MATNPYTPGTAIDLSTRFRGFLPVVVDVETGGFKHQSDALLEIAAVTIGLDDQGKFQPQQAVSTHVIPFEGANMDPSSLAVNGIDPYHPLRAARKEQAALGYIFKPVREAVKNAGCTRAILVGHNAAFDQGFLNAAVARTGIKRNPFHPFSNFDTVSFAGLALGQTVLAKAVKAAGISWDSSEAHSALYDTQKTAELFCFVLNQWEGLQVSAQPEQ